MALTQPQVDYYDQLVRSEHYRLNSAVSAYFNCNNESLQPEEIRQAVKLLESWRQPRIEAVTSINKALREKVDEIRNRLILMEGPASSIAPETLFAELAELVPSSVPIPPRDSSPSDDDDDYEFPF
jgi:hypothetical protein